MIIIFWLLKLYLLIQPRSFADFKRTDIQSLKERIVSKQNTSGLSIIRPGDLDLWPLTLKSTKLCQLNLLEGKKAVWGQLRVGPNRPRCLWGQCLIRGRSGTEGQGDEWRERRMESYLKAVNQWHTRRPGTARWVRTRWSVSECPAVRRWRSNVERCTPLHKHCKDSKIIHCARKKTKPYVLREKIAKSQQNLMKLCQN